MPFDVFISFAEPDRELAQTLKRVLTALDLSTYFAPESTLRNSPQDWQRSILKDGLKGAKCFLPIFTRNSLSRPWVLFEAGAAAALGIQFVVARTDAVKESEVSNFPFAFQPHHHKLYDVNDLKAMATTIAIAKHGEAARENISQNVDSLFANRPELINALTCQARRRWVFIAGNLAKNSRAKHQKRGHLGRVTELVTMRLIESGFNISACPQVDPVGKVAFETAQSTSGKICTKTGCDIECEIGGIYPIDQPDTKYSGDVRDRWKEQLLKFRKSYLANKQWLIVLGGNEGSLEEFEAVDQLNREGAKIKVCFVTCYGGAARKAFKEKHKQQPNLYFDGSEGWNSRRHNERDLAERIVTTVLER